MQLPLIILTASAAALAGAQVVFNTTTDQFVCPSTPPNGAYCTGPSLTSNIIIRCTGTTGVAGNCNDNLAGEPPIGVKEFAPCYESTPSASDAACSYGGTVYPDLGSSFSVPGPGSTNTTTTTNSTSASITPTTSAPVRKISTSTATTALASNISTTLTDIFVFSSSALAALAPFLSADIAPNNTVAATLLSAPYPIPSAANNTAAASGSGVAPSKTGGLSPAFAGAAGRSYVGAVVASGVAVAATCGMVLLLLL